jgi:hypothetical protein
LSPRPYLPHCSHALASRAPETARSPLQKAIGKEIHHATSLIVIFKLQIQLPKKRWQWVGLTAQLLEKSPLTKNTYTISKPNNVCTSGHVSTKSCRPYCFRQERLHPRERARRAGGASCLYKLCVGSCDSMLVLLYVSET